MADVDPELERIFDDFGEIFRDLMFGGNVPSRDLRLELTITLGEAVEGAERSVQIGRSILCRPCRGTRGANGATFTRCQACGGTGGEQLQQGYFVFSKPCESCHGKRGVWSEECAACAGTGGQWKLDSLTVKVPGGVTEGHVLRLAGKGNDLADGQGPGDAHLSIVITPDARFVREGDHLHVRAYVPRQVAREGGTIEVPLVSGTRRARVKAGARSGDELVLAGCGAVKLGSPAVPVPVSDEPYRSTDARAHRGDLIVTLEVEGEPLPDEKLTLDERDERENARSDRRFLVGLAIAAAVLVGAFVYAAMTH